MKELERKEQSWQDYLISSGWATQSSNNKKTKKYTPSVVIKEASLAIARLVKNPLNKSKLFDR